MTWAAEVFRCRLSPGDWRVEKIDSDGDGGIDVTIFSGPNAEERARAYLAWAYPAAEGGEAEK